MKIHDLAYEPIDRVDGASASEVAELIASERRPIIFSGLHRDFEFLRAWTLEHLTETLDNGQVLITRPGREGVNTIVQFFPLTMHAFAERIGRGENLYVGAREILGAHGARSDKHGFGPLSAELVLPEWIDTTRLVSANLWLGGGNDRTLLHFDPWNSILMLGQGEKEFFVFPDTEAKRMPPYGAFDLLSIARSQIIHSKINPLDVQPRYQAEFAKARGLRGTLRPGETIFVPAGFFHYVESKHFNVAVNFFVHFKDRRLQWVEPLKTYWIKDNVTMWPNRALLAFKRALAPTYRRYFPRVNAE